MTNLEDENDLLKKEVLEARKTIIKLNRDLAAKENEIIQKDKAVFKAESELEKYHEQDLENLDFEIYCLQRVIIKYKLLKVKLLSKSSS